LPVRPRKQLCRLLHQLAAGGYFEIGHKANPLDLFKFAFQAE
jgi:hypothetical protein